MVVVNAIASVPISTAPSPGGVSSRLAHVPRGLNSKLSQLGCSRNGAVLRKESSVSGIDGGRRGKTQHLFQCSAFGETSVTEIAEASGASSLSDENSWIPVIPIIALPKGERRLIRQDGEDILLLWYKDDVYALENTSPAEGAYSEGFVNARLTPDGSIVCPSTDTTFDLKTGQIKDWYPTNPILRFLTRPVRELDVYPVKQDSDYIYVNFKRIISGQSAEIVFGGQTKAGQTATDVNVDEVKMIVDENEGGFGWTSKNEIINGRAAMIGFSMLLITELVTGKGFLSGIGFLDFLYRYIFTGFPLGSN